MKLEIKGKEIYSKVRESLTGLVSGRLEVKPGIFLELSGPLDYRLSKRDGGVAIEFPKNKLKVVATKWVFQLDGFIERILIGEKVVVEISGMPDLEIILT